MVGIDTIIKAQAKDNPRLSNRLEKIVKLSEEYIEILRTEYPEFFNIPIGGKQNVDNDIISHPAHYCFSDYEPKDVIRAWGLNFNLGSAIKYISRSGRKDDAIQDLKKARQFLEFEIDALEKEKKSV